MIDPRHNLGMHKTDILLVEDDKDLCNTIVRLMPEYNFTCFYDMPNADLNIFKAYKLLLIDEVLPSGSGFSFAKNIKEKFPQIKIIFITSQSTKTLVIECLNIGINKFLEKPFTLADLKNKMSEILDQNEIIQMTDGFALNLGLGVVEYNGVVLDLTPTEFKLIEYLMKNNGKSVSREKIIDYVWEKNHQSLNTLDTHLSNLRKKVPVVSEKIKNVRGRGYFWA